MQRQKPSKSKRFHQTTEIPLSEDPEDRGDRGDSPGRGFRRTWRFPIFSSQSRWSMTLLRVQKTAQMPLVQFTEKLVKVTMIMRTSSGSPSTSAYSGDASDSNSSEWVNTPTVQPTAPEGCRDDTGAVQGDEHAIRRQMPNIKKISNTVEITHAVIQGQVPNIAKTDELPQAQFMPRRCTTNSCAETVPNA